LAKHEGAAIALDDALGRAFTAWSRRFQLQQTAGDRLEAQVEQLNREVVQSNEKNDLLQDTLNERIGSLRKLEHDLKRCQEDLKADKHRMDELSLTAESRLDELGKCRQALTQCQGEVKASEGRLDELKSKLDESVRKQESYRKQYEAQVFVQHRTDAALVRRRRLRSF